MKYSFATLMCVLLLAGCGRHEPEKNLTSDSAVPHGQPTIVGIGIQLTIKDNALEVMDVLPDSPAARAGLHSGMTIQQINGTNITGIPLAELVAMARGPVGSKVKLEVIDPTKSETNTVEFTREKIAIPSGASAKPPAP